MLHFYPPDYHAYSDDHGIIASILVAIRARVRARTYGRLLPPKGGRLFDVGAGDCRHFTELSRCPGLSFAGVEINADMGAKARRAGYDVETGTLERMDLARHVGQYSIVSMNHVLEHVVDPREVVLRCFRLLQPGGWLIGQLPTKSSWEYDVFGERWAGYHFPRHLQVFSRPGLLELLTRCGFTSVQFRSTPHVQIALSVQNTFVAKGARSRIRFGRAPYFGLLLLLSLPLEVIAALCDRSGVIHFRAQRPL